MDVEKHVQALFVAVASSTDNFLVGLSLGLSQKPLRWQVNIGIALCNALGCLVATSSGSLGARYFMDDQTANGIACVAFAYLAVKEYREVSDNAMSETPKSVSMDLALPMTLNNLAGGVTAGVLGVAPWWNFVYAFVVSVVTMWLGRRLGKVFSGLRNHKSIIYGPICIYLVLSLQSFTDMWY